MCDDTELWRPIPSWPAYEISNHGRVRRTTPYRSTRVGKILRPYLNKGYFAVRVNVSGRRQARTIHSLVAEAFIGPRPDGAVINHKDTCKTNNRVDNLEYTTSAANAAHAQAHGLYPSGDAAAPRRYPEKYREAQAKALRNRRPDAGRGQRAGAYTHPERHPRGSRNGQAKLSDEEIQTIRRLIAEGQTNIAIAAQFNVHHSTISLIRTGKHWRHIE